MVKAFNEWLSLVGRGKTETSRTRKKPSRQRGERVVCLSKKKGSIRGILLSDNGLAGNASCAYSADADADSGEGLCLNAEQE